MKRSALLLVVALALAACDSDATPLKGSEHVAGTEITFSIAIPDEEKPAIQELLSRFQKRTRARVNVSFLSRFRNQPASRVSLTTSIDSMELIRTLGSANGAKPVVHLFAQDNLALTPLVDARLVQDVSDVEIPRKVISSMVPPKSNGRRFFLPFRPNVRLTYLDRSQLLAAGVRPPATTQDLLVVARKLKAGAGRPVVTLSLAEGDPAAVTLSELIVSYGGDPLVLNDAGSKEAFTFLDQMWSEGLLARESLFARYDTEVEYLRAGTTSLAQNWSFTSAVLAKQGLLGRFQVYPGWRGPARAAHVIGGDVLGIPRGVKGRQRAAAVALAGFLMSKEAQELLVQENAWASIRTDAYSMVSKAQKGTFDAIQQAFEDGWFRPSVEYWPEVTARMNEAVQRILLQRQDVTAVLDELHEKLEAARRSA
ncbi:MAG TPA: extracellular solute-binding protein [Acidimicrobiales bacterium]|nr:extracellular solute-binding protein [Acidimicrobiales bacterium]